MLSNNFFRYLLCYKIYLRITLKKIYPNSFTIKIEVPNLIHNFKVIIKLTINIM